MIVARSDQTVSPLTPSSCAPRCCSGLPFCAGVGEARRSWRRRRRQVPGGREPAFCGKRWWWRWWRRGRVLRGAVKPVVLCGRRRGRAARTTPTHQGTAFFSERRRYGGASLPLLLLLQIGINDTARRGAWRRRRGSAFVGVVSSTFIASVWESPGPSFIFLLLDNYPFWPACTLRPYGERQLRPLALTTRCRARCSCCRRRQQLSEQRAQRQGNELVGAERVNARSGKVESQNSRWGHRLTDRFVSGGVAGFASTNCNDGTAMTTFSSRSVTDTLTASKGL